MKKADIWKQISASELHNTIVLVYGFSLGKAFSSLEHITIYIRWNTTEHTIRQENYAELHFT